MTYSSDRLDRIEALLATVAESNAASTQRLDRVESVLAATADRLTRAEQVAESNARAIEAWSSRIEDGIAEAEAVSSSTAANTNRRMEEAITDTVQMIADLGRQQQAARERSDQLNAEHSQRFEVFLQDARADRQRFDQAIAANSEEHRAFTQNIQVLLAEIARLWQRVAG
ncbi:hypothetical protein [Nodosilinea sp. E11]|uniref:hypothetical protein n=1 Tax=Nodosilinea sp. E11 TaxID=3037479 RepID=UPI0029348C40|nr:hypothetical protein [Nodosilinea sp. E11]WOD37294.1 hypothetical protein RRF56_02080 [Nodosilinea sp. E11]